MDEIPETWDTVKRKNPIHPTCSRGKFGEVQFCNEKYHCYGVKHSTPTYNLMPYQPEGFGYAERAMKYIPLEHVHNRGRPSPPTKRLLDKYFMREVYENSIDAIRRKRDKVAVSEPSIRETDRLRDKFRYKLANLKNKTNEFIGETRYRCYSINKTVRLLSAE